MTSVLVLNADYSILGVIPWQEAICKVLMDKVEVIEAYADRVIRSASRTFQLPAVVRLTTGYSRRRVRLSRKHIIARDKFQCQYCGLKPTKLSGAPDTSKLTIDHIVPRSRARRGMVDVDWSLVPIKVNSWQNVTTACEPCNTGKAAHTPGEAGMHLMSTPDVPNTLDIAWMSILRHKIPSEWSFYLPTL